MPSTKLTNTKQIVLQALNKQHIWIGILTNLTFTNYLTFCIVDKCDIATICMLELGEHWLGPGHMMRVSIIQVPNILLGLCSQAYLQWHIKPLILVSKSSWVLVGYFLQGWQDCSFRNPNPSNLNILMQPQVRSIRYVSIITINIACIVQVSALFNKNCFGIFARGKNIVA